ncbi:MAG: hypothetical protein II953_00405 [Clostridia bacterium]|nr:hypothetical protein [Clostridia bacterium]MBQ3862043.1 hypothetical protein [Clostridia bacterium]MBQ3956685.1 hypothetical protein [Clostridia bacterium]MBQ5356463.1 hypothetical protein [Clostridia bacterium]
MRNIVLSDGADTVTLLSDLEFVWRPKLIGERAVMASGRTVADVTGIKHTAEIPVGWLSPEDLSKLVRMIAKNAALTVSYPTAAGDRHDVCFVGMPEFRAFRYGADGVSQWYGVTLSVEQAGVEEAGV